MACAAAIMSVSPPVTRTFSLSDDQNDKYIIIFYCYHSSDLFL